MAWHEKVGDQYRGRYLDAKGRKRTAVDPTTGKKLVASKKRALQIAHDAEAEIRRGNWIDPQAGTITFTDYFEKKWRPNKMGELNTLAMYDSHYNHSLKPVFGEMQLRQILPSTVQGWVKQQQEDGVSPISIQKRYRCLQTILAGKRGISAVRDRLISANPCEGIELPTVPEREVTIYEPDEIDALFEEIDDWWLPLVALYLDLGVRWGELMGLQVEDFALGFKTVTVRRTIVQVSKKYTKNGTPFRTKEYPKGKKQRKLAVSPDVAQLILDMIEQRGLKPGDRLFSMPEQRHWRADCTVLTVRRTEEWPHGFPVSRTHFRRYVWEPAIERAGVPARRLHDLRATNISWLLAGTQNVAMVMERAGHVHFSTTKRYMVALREADTEAVAVLASVRSKYGTRQPGTRRRTG